MAEKKRIISIKTGLNPDEKQQAVLSDIFRVFNSYKHSFFMESLRNIDLKEKDFRHQDGRLDRRWSRSAEEDVNGMKDSIQSNRKNDIEYLKGKLNQTEKEIKIAKEKHDNALKNKEVFSLKLPKLLSSLQYLHRRKIRLENKIKRLHYDYHNKKFYICFGSKRLFKQQFEENISHIEWKNSWTDSRYNSFRLTGAKHETCGNANAQLHYVSSNCYDLKIRIPSCLEETYGKYITLNNISFYEKGRKKDLSSRELMQYIILNNNNKSSLDRRPLTINVSKIKEKYRLTVQFTPVEVEIKTSHLNGVVGIDMNADNFAVADIDSKGKILETKIFRFNLKNKSTGQRENIIFHAMNKVVDFALSKGKDLVYEDLNFTEKKQQLYKSDDKKYNAMLSSFAYTKMKEQLLSRCFKMGVKAHKINPAYTSLLGRLIHSRRYGLSVHEAAAYTIARKYYQIKEWVKSFITLNHHGKTFMFTIPEQILKSDGDLQLAKLQRWVKTLYKSQSKWKVYERTSNLNPSTG
jgi:IS605 OrfB family transposase